jgi:hypothetical protein
MQKEGLTLEEGAQIRTLVDFPGGLELHIGVSMHMALRLERRQLLVLHSCLTCPLYTLNQLAS